MKKHIIQLAVIYTLAVGSGVFAFSYISNGINALVPAKSVSSTISTKPTPGPHRIVVGPNVQPAYVYSNIVLQPAVSDLPKIANPQANQTGGNGQNTELQPALGYGALDKVIQ